MERNPRCVWVFLGVVIASFMSACSQEKPSSVYRDGSSAALTRPSTINLDRLAVQAKAQGKNVYLEFTAPWCHYCRNFQSTVLSTPESQQALKKVIFVQANFDREKPLAHQFGVRAIPAGLLLKPQNGQLVVIDRHVGGLTQTAFVKFLSR